MTNEIKFKTQFPDFKGEVYFEILDKWGDITRIITFIDVPGNKIMSTYYFTAECGCCSDSDEDTESLKDLDYFEDDEFEGLVEEIAKQI